MNINKLSEKLVEETPHKVNIRKLYDKESAQAMHIILLPGEALKPHITPVDVFFYVLEGTPEILVGEEKVQINADVLVESPKDIVHCIYNHSTQVARILVVKAPRPTMQAKLL
ncbi:MAG TPA: cupin domain-containing protein [Prolixibacteraceae bacterium]|nr:cupin domain-containing protein [Prolixibacteraceae bacterium]